MSGRGKILSFEALARWRHPVRGAVSPVEFIPIIEDIGLMEEFGAGVLSRACAACAAWPDRRQRVGQSGLVAVPQRKDRGDRRRGAGARAGLSPQPPRPRDHRIDPARRPLRHARRAGGLARARLPHLARRFRHRLFQPQLSPQLPARPHQDRPLLHNGPRGARARLDPGRERRGDEPQARHDRADRGGRDRAPDEGRRTLGTIAEAQGFLFSRPVPLADVAALFNRERRAAA